MKKQTRLSHFAISMKWLKTLPFPCSGSKPAVSSGGVGGGVVCFFLNKILVVHHECVQLHLKEDILPSVTQDTHPPTHTKKQNKIPSPCPNLPTANKQMKVYYPCRHYQTDRVRDRMFQRRQLAHEVVSYSFFSFLFLFFFNLDTSFSLTFNLRCSVLVVKPD